MDAITIPPTRAADVEPAKDFLFSVYGEGLWTEERYLDLSGRTNRIIELSEGRLIVPPMPTPEHQDVVGALYLILRAWARRHGGRAFVAALPVRLWAGKFREPDVILYTREHTDRIEKQYAGVPDLAVEVLSPSTEKVDLAEKMQEYAEAGIPEYWIVDAESPRLEQYVLAQGRYTDWARYGPGETVRAATLADLEFPLAQLYAQE
ncbi:MAG: Uma2 family endonuclease [Anaerolineales bacterium]|nr:Uma2 family endonuclease [Anaerolineales bacterium]